MRVSSRDRRLVIAYFAGEAHQKALGAVDGLRRTYGASYISLHAPNEGSKSAGPYSDLKLPGESLIVARVPISDLSSATQTIQLAGARSIFLFAGSSPDPPGEEECPAIGVPLDWKSLTERMAAFRRELENSQEYLIESIRIGHPASPAAQWITDNAYMVQLTLTDLQPEFKRIYRELKPGQLETLWRLSRKYLALSELTISEDGLIRFLDEAQSHEELSSAQLWAFPLFLRVVISEQLLGLACRSRRVQHLRETAFLWADRVSHSARQGKSLLEQTLQRLKAQPFLRENSFSVALAEQLQDQETALHGWLRTIERAPLPEMVRAEHTREAADALMAANAFGSLRTIAKIDLRKVYEAVSRIERVLRRDPSRTYGKSNFSTRDYARQMICRIAKQSGRDEVAVAEAAIRLATSHLQGPANQVLYYAFDEGIADLERATGAKVTLQQKVLRGFRANATGIYIGGIWLLTLSFLSVALSLAWDQGVRSPLLFVLLGTLAAFPLSELATQIIQSLIISTFPPAVSPKMNFEEGVPDDARTLVVVPMMLNSAAGIRAEIEKLEIRFLANRQQNLQFALFSDFVDSPEPVAPSDTPLLQEAKRGIAALNTKYGNGDFLLFHRKRVWSPSEQKWIGRERKRGKLEDLNAFLTGEPLDIVAEGSFLWTPRYVIVLDADTKLPPRAAQRMIETIAHPLHRVVTDQATGVRIRGYSIIQPRVMIDLPGATATRFTRIFSDAQGSDPYCTVVSDAQQDLFGEGIFHGKAIYDVEAFHRILANRFPGETILSHDLIEGAHAGVCFASDIELLENIPLNYSTFARRQHRWTRGDWQIASWATGSVPTVGGRTVPNPLSTLNRWRVLDNLRRSLAPCASLLLLMVGWFFSVAPGVWTIVIAVAVGIPALVPLLDRWSRHLEGTTYGWQGAADDLKRAIVMLAFLPHQAWLSGDAVIRAIYRQKITRRHMLEWQTAEDAESARGPTGDPTVRQLTVIAIFSTVALMMLAMQGAFAPTFAVLGLWMAAPWLAQWLATAVPPATQAPLGEAERTDLRRLARRTWRYFDDLVGPETNWLPPDNTQLALRVEVAARTSPTNIGLWLNSALAARDFGYLTTDEFVRRTSETLVTMERLERYEGHLLNWFDTATLQPLLPRYVSTVDSGNLIASLWVYAQGARELTKSPIIGQFTMAGLIDTAAIVRRVTHEDLSMHFPLQGLIEALQYHGEGLRSIGQLRLANYHVSTLRESTRWTADAADEVSYWVRKLGSEVSAWVSQVDRYLRWMEVLSRPGDDMLRTLGPDAVEQRRSVLMQLPSLSDLAAGPPPGLSALLRWRGTQELRPDVAEWLALAEREFTSAQNNAVTMCAALESMAAEADRIAARTNMAFLYDAQRRLFGIGYSVGTPAVFTSHYDLLASECRLASLVAIAKGDVPIEHWFVLGRPRVSSPKREALLSWSGTMFEYLMPLLYTEPFENSLLSQACQEAVDAQVAYGRRVGLPWGISECAYGALDNNRIYQYRAFGVPGLALNPNVDPGPVIAPYATVMALMVKPQAAIDNLRRLLGLEMAGAMGFYESIDFTRPGKKDEKSGLMIYAYMAHHQGMSLLSLSNALSENAIQRRRFHSDPRIRAVESLLFERVPIARVEAEEIVRPTALPEAAHVPDRTWTEQSAVPHVFLSSNGCYSLMVSNNGGGYSQWRGNSITRWRSDAALDDWGHYIWVRDLRSDAVWLASHPYQGPAGERFVAFSSDRAEFVRCIDDLETRLEITTTSDDDGELRRLTVSNRTLRTRQVEITTYVELVLAPPAADAAHPLFAKMFVETEAIGDNVLIARRRPRMPEDTSIWVAAVLSGAPQGTTFETDRRAFIGRNRETIDADGIRGPLSRTTGPVLDPVFSFRCKLTLEAREQAQIGIFLLAAESRDALLAAVKRYEHAEYASRVVEMAWTRAQLDFRHLRIGSAAGHRFQELAGHILYPNPALRYSSSTTAPSSYGQRELWKFGISGDLPIVTVTAPDMAGTELVREMLLAKAYWRLRGLEVDLVILNREAPGYEAPLRKVITRLIQAHLADTGERGSGRAYLLDWHALDANEQSLLLHCARVALGSHRGPLQRQLIGAVETAQTPGFIAALPPAAYPAVPLPAVVLMHQNGTGGFTQNGKEYVIDLSPEASTPVPWCNVIANPEFGTLVTDAGMGFTWAANSQMNRLTPWHNDPVTDRQSEVIYLRDEEDGSIWCPTPSPLRGRSSFRIRHGQGYSSYEHHQGGFHHLLTVFVARTSPVKIAVLRLRNDSGRVREISATYFAEWVLGSQRDQQQSHVQTAFDADIGMLTAKQSWVGAFSRQVAFAACSPKAKSHSGDRLEFFGRSGSFDRPNAMQRSGLGNRTGVGMDPCAALQTQLTIADQETRSIVFLIGEAASTEDAAAIAARFSNLSEAEAELAAVRAAWDEVLDTIRVRTPSSTVNVMLNRWLLYQAMSCRYWGRSALYQSGGAIGFRDQLQDCLALIYTAPDMTRNHILRAAAHQFLEGDVQHWWHPVSGLGVRTRCSDDLLWLPWVVARYIEITGDSTILDEDVPFLEAPELAPHEHEKMFEAQRSSQSASLFEHCVRAIERGSQVGPHGLPLIGNGDWNDGMNLVGVEGRGESVWLAWFLLDTLRQWQSMVPDVPADLLESWRRRSQELVQATERHAWDGEWYLRGFFDDGSPLGASSNAEAQIDSLPQSWAVISTFGNPARVRHAMDSAMRRLVRPEDGTVLLFTPPFDTSRPHPGYIMGYPPGTRENGGQYTHGALWLAQAQTRLGDGAAAVKILQITNPAERTLLPEGVVKYRGEPYVAAADVSSSPLRTGASGWTWYTGSAGWMYRIWLEDVLGFRLKGKSLEIRPVLPPDWSASEIEYRYGASTTYRILISRLGAGSTIRMESNGLPLQTTEITLTDDGEFHEIRVWIGGEADLSRAEKSEGPEQAHQTETGSGQRPLPA